MCWPAASGRILDVNPALCALAGRSREDLAGSSLARLFEAFPWDRLEQAGGASVQGFEAVLRHADGHQLHVLFNGSVRRNADGQLESVTGLMTDITGRKQAESRLQELATHDTLTGLPNRALLHERLQRMLEACRADPVATMFLDLDRFKEVNDSFGHELATCCCAKWRRACARCCGRRRGGAPGRRRIRGGGRLRQGSERGAAAHRREAARRADRADQRSGPGRGHRRLDRHQHVPARCATKELLFQTADTAMYRAKAAGRNRYRFFEPEMTVAARARMALETVAAAGAGAREFELHYQPRIDLRSMAMVGMEALIRWNHPQQGMVPPQQFIGSPKRRA
jgi:PAS domain S-box-containing protein